MHEQTGEKIPLQPEDVSRLALDGAQMSVDQEGHPVVILRAEVFAKEKLRVEKAQRARARAKRKAADASRRDQRR